MSLPLLTFEMYPVFIAADKGPVEEKRNNMKKAVLLLPENNRKILDLLCNYLKEVSQNDSINLMNTKNLSIVIAPNILWPSKRSAVAEIADAAHVTGTIQSLIDDYDYYFQEREQQQDIGNTEDFSGAMRAYYLAHKRESKRALYLVKDAHGLDDMTFQLQTEFISEKIQEGDENVVNVLIENPILEEHHKPHRKNSQALFSLFHETKQQRPLYASNVADSPTKSPHAHPERKKFRAAGKKESHKLVLKRETSKRGTKEDNNLTIDSPSLSTPASPSPDRAYSKNDKLAVLRQSEASRYRASSLDVKKNSNSPNRPLRPNAAAKTRTNNVAEKRRSKKGNNPKPKMEKGYSLDGSRMRTMITQHVPKYKKVNNTTPDVPVSPVILLSARTRSRSFTDLMSIVPLDKTNLLQSASADVSLISQPSENDVTSDSILDTISENKRENQEKQNVDENPSTASVVI